MHLRFRCGFPTSLTLSGRGEQSWARENFVFTEKWTFEVPLGRIILHPAHVPIFARLNGLLFVTLRTETSVAITLYRVVEVIWIRSFLTYLNCWSRTLMTISDMRNVQYWNGTQRNDYKYIFFSRKIFGFYIIVNKEIPWFRLTSVPLFRLNFLVLMKNFTSKLLGVVQGLIELGRKRAGL